MKAVAQPVSVERTLMRRTHKCAGLESEKACEHPEKLKHEAEECTHEQVRKGVINGRL
jgi:hypothetical protein